MYLEALPHATKIGKPFQIECHATGYPQPTLANYEIDRLGPGLESLSLTEVAGGVVATVKEASASDHRYQCRVNLNWRARSLQAYKKTTVTVYSKCPLIMQCLHIVHSNGHLC